MTKNRHEILKFRSIASRIRDKIVEEFNGIEELRSMLGFFFSKLHGTETFNEKSKYFLISKQIVFFALQRSLGKIETLEKNIDYLVSLEILDKKILNNIAEIMARLKKLETLYNQNKIKEVVGGMKEIGTNVSSIKNDFKLSERYDGMAIEWQLIF